MNTTYTLTPLWIIGTSIGGGVLVMTAFIFPVKLPVVYRRPGIQFVPVLVGVLIAALILMIYANPLSPQSAVTAIWLAPLTAIAGMVIFVLILLRRRGSAVLISMRDQANTVLIGVLLALAVALIWVLNLALRPILGVTPIPFNTSAAMPFFILPPLEHGIRRASVPHFRQRPRHQSGHHLPDHAVGAAAGLFPAGFQR